MPNMKQKEAQAEATNVPYGIGWPFAMATILAYFIRRWEKKPL